MLLYGYFWVSLGSKGLKLILLSIKDNGFYENSYTLGGAMAPPAPPLNPRLPSGVPVNGPLSMRISSQRKFENRCTSTAAFCNFSLVFRSKENIVEFKIVGATRWALPDETCLSFHKK